jgi:hypothetical protein
VSTSPASDMPGAGALDAPPPIDVAPPAVGDAPPPAPEGVASATVPEPPTFRLHLAPAPIVRSVLEPLTIRLAATQPSQPRGAAEKPTSQDVLLEQWRIHVETYRHHFELFVKGMVLHFTVVGAIWSVLYTKDVIGQTRVLPLLLVIVGSCTAIGGCVVSEMWTRRIQKHVGDLLLDPPGRGSASAGPARRADSTQAVPARPAATPGAR